MDSNPGPVLRRRQAGVRLRQLREAAGRSLADVASYLDCSAAKVSRIETGRMVARLPDVRNMLDYYAAPAADRTELLELVRGSRERGWWQSYTDVLTEGMDTFYGLTDAAHTIDWFHPTMIPGLVQTRDYLYALHSPHVEVSDAHVERWVELKLAAQQILIRADPPTLNVFMDESAVRRGPESPLVLREQLAHLRALNDRPNISIRLVRFDAGFLPVHLGLCVLGLPDPDRPRVMFQEGLWNMHFDPKPEMVGRACLAFDRLRATALSPADTATFLASVEDGLAGK